MIITTRRTENPVTKEWVEKHVRRVAKHMKGFPHSEVHMYLRGVMRSLEAQEFIVAFAIIFEQQQIKGALPRFNIMFQMSSSSQLEHFYLP